MEGVNKMRIATHAALREVYSAMAATYGNEPIKGCNAQTLTEQKRQTVLRNCNSGGFAVFLWRILKKGATTNADPGLVTMLRRGEHSR